MKFHRQRWHNQKYYTWVEQQGNSERSGEALMQCSAQQSDELRALANPDFWLKEQAKPSARLVARDAAMLCSRQTPEIDKQLAKPSEQT